VRTPRIPAEANAETNTDQPRDCAAVPPLAKGLSHYARKRHARLQVEGALQGVALRRLADGRWLACRWGLSKELADSEVEVWLQRVGGRHV